jgi:hypothetical protein
MSARACAIVILSLAAAVVSARDSDDRARLARELVDVMRLAEQAEELIEKQILARCHREKCDNEAMTCMLKLDREELVRHFLNIAKMELTIEELRAAVGYFRTEVGEKHRQILRAERGLARTSLAEQSPEDRQIMLAFLDTRAGYLLFTRAVLTNTSQVNALIRRTAFLAWDDCLPRAQ